MNPMRSFAPELLRGDVTTDWICVIGPVLSAMIAVVFESILKGHATASGTVAAQGDSRNVREPPMSVRGNQVLRSGCVVPKGYPGSAQLPDHHTRGRARVFQGSHNLGAPTNRHQRSPQAYWRSTPVLS